MPEEDYTLRPKLSMPNGQRSLQGHKVIVMDEGHHLTRPNKMLL